jgi:hypothetical protein
MGSMTTDQVLVTIIAALLSGLIGVVVSFYFYARLERRKMKMDTARKLFGGKYSQESQAFQEALNEVMLVFADSRDVLRALDDLFTTIQSQQHGGGIGDDKLVRLMKAICQDLGITYKELPEAYFLRSFRVPTTTPRP